MTRMLDRRNFLHRQLPPSPLLCTIGGKTVEVTSAKDVGAGRQGRREDASAPHGRRPAAAAVPSQFPTPEPAPGGQVREYWVQARSVTLGHRPEEGRRVDEAPDQRAHAGSAPSSTS